MWQPDPGWQPVPGGMGTSTTGIWLADEGGRKLVVKRIGAPHAGDPGELSDRRHFAWWRRPVEVATSQFTATAAATAVVLFCCEPDCPDWPDWASFAPLAPFEPFVPPFDDGIDPVFDEVPCVFGLLPLTCSFAFWSPLESDSSAPLALAT